LSDVKRLEEYAANDKVLKDSFEKQVATLNSKINDNLLLAKKVF
jgi:hypothetical protein